MSQVPGHKLALVFGIAITIGAGQPNKPQSEREPKETIAKPLTAKEARRRDKQLRAELQPSTRKWLQEEVGYIITDEERTALSRLANDEERDQFIEQFWLRRDPTPDTEENEYKEEHYRRIAYANEHFASGIPGWRSDRGRIYITLGPPDEIESHAAGGTYNRPSEEGGGVTSVFPFEKWRYRHIESVGSDVQVEFVDATMSGEYRMTTDPSEKDALLYVPGAGPTLNEQIGLSKKIDRFTRGDGTRLGIGSQLLPAGMNQFDRLRQAADLMRPPAVKFKDLQALVTSTVRYNRLPMKVRYDVVPLTGSSILTSIMIQFERKDLEFQQKDGVARSVVNIYAGISSMGGRLVNRFEETVSTEAPVQLLEEAARGASVYQKSVPLAPGRYRLNVVAKDVHGGTVNSTELALDIPRFEDGVLAASSLILADVVEKVPVRSIGTGQFVIGGTKVRPRIDGVFRQDEALGVWAQLYHFAPNEKTGQADGSIRYSITGVSSNEAVFAQEEPVGGSAAQMAFERRILLDEIRPGAYRFTIEVTDRVSGQSLTRSAPFRVDGGRSSAAAK